MAKKKKSKIIEKHRIVLKNILENKGNRSEIKKQLMEMGYSESYIDSGLLKKTQSWQDLMEEFLPDKLLAKGHKKLLTATKLEHMVFPQTINDAEITELLKEANCNVRKIQRGDGLVHVWFWARDNTALKNGLDMAYKLKQKYGNITIKHKFSELSDEEIERESATIISEALRLAEGESEEDTGEQG